RAGVIANVGYNNRIAVDNKSQVERDMVTLPIYKLREKYGNEFAAKAARDYQEANRIDLRKASTQRTNDELAKDTALVAGAGLAKGVGSVASVVPELAKRYRKLDTPLNNPISDALLDFTDNYNNRASNYIATKANEASEYLKDKRSTYSKVEGDYKAL